MADIVLVLGSAGQVGTDLVSRLRHVYGSSNVVATDIRMADNSITEEGPFELVNVLDDQSLIAVFKKYRPAVVYHLAAMLSATAEENPKKGWELNMDGLFKVFDLCLEYHVQRVFWPSSIAVFGPGTPKLHTPQHCIMDPNTIYGISKLAGERYCEYYHKRWGLDVRSVRYPGLIGWKALPGGGTTDYAVDIFHQALKSGHYTCFLKEGTVLPMMYMDDAIKATIDITEAPAEMIKIRSSYNIAGFSFGPEDLAAEIRRHIPAFEIDYEPDKRQAIAESWPQSIDDTEAREHWNWRPEYDIDRMVGVMLENLKSLVSSK